MQLEGGLATNPDGTLSDMPRDLAHSLSYQLGQVVALLAVAIKECPDSDEDDAPDPYHNARSRTVSLIEVAGREVRSVMHAMSPYV
jgi:hypothetical protein